ncbi:MAG: sulfatase-like hydrolase/transferase, partial [Pirellulaceae bacterium]|nr:sulfatase-like hydrolase/transferase [Pirellulaceae bacterium]
PAFRGTGAVGVANGFQTAVRWDATNPGDKSVLWKSPIPGLGHSCPTIVGNRLFVATAVATDNDAPLQVGRGGNTDAADDNSEQSWMVLCFDKTTGRELWRQTAHEGVPKATRHTKATHANTTVTIDGDNVVAFFGSEGLYCYDLDGNLKWKTDLGVVNISKYGIGWGYGSSPAIHDGHIVLVCDDPENPYIVALNLVNGEEVWRKSRKEDSQRSWGTPLIHKVGDGAQVVVNGWPWIVAYDLATGDETWRVEGGGDNPIPTPFIVDDRIYITNSHGGKSPIIAVRSDAKGNLAEADSPADAGLVWRTERGGTYMSTPVIVGDHLYLGNTNGVLRCYNVNTGEEVYEERIASGAYIVASLVAADDKIYCTAEDGTVYVIKAGSKFELLAQNRLGEPCLATPAISAGVLFFRTAHSLIAVGPNSDAADAHAVATDDRKPNILFIAVDDLRPSLGCYGDELAVSPNIDSLAASGMTFNRAYCQVAVCNPSRASLMTGLRPDTLGVWTLPIHFRESKPDAVTIPQWFIRSGYAAVSHGKIFHNPTPDPQSWSEPIRDLPALPFPYPDGTRERVRQAMEELPQRDWRKNNLRNPSTAAPDLPDNKLMDGARTDMCIEDLKRLGSSAQPFMLAMGYIRPHLAFVAPKKYWDIYDPEKLPVLTDQQTPIGAPPYSLHNNSELSHYVDLIKMPTPWSDETLPPEKMRQLIHGYYACVSYVDAQIGRLLKTLDDEGLRDNTIVVLWSDHGWKPGEYRGWGKLTNYEIDTRVPLIISAPGMKTGGQKSDSLVELLDLYPTLCELTGVDVPSFVEGRSLVPVLRDPEAQVHQSAVSQYYRKHEGREYMGYSLRTDQYRYVEWRDFGTGEMVDQELYDHNESDLETVNQVNRVSPETVSRLRVLLKSTHPPKKLEMVPAVHTSPSGLGRLAVDISFDNETDTEITVYPIVPSGKRNRGRKIAPGQSFTFHARIGGAYVVESKDGSIHEIHSPSWPARPVVIRK